MAHRLRCQGVACTEGCERQKTRVARVVAESRDGVEAGREIERERRRMILCENMKASSLDVCV